MVVAVSPTDGPTLIQLNYEYSYEIVNQSISPPKSGNLSPFHRMMIESRSRGIFI